MRRYLLTIFCLPLITMLFVGCTLSMEEYAIEEEMSRGFDEPYTEVTDIGTFTYQYHDNVRPVTKRVLEYVLGVEADSIVYYAENCPEEWLPYVGGYVSSGCSRKIPHGMNHRVLSVQHENGYYKVTTTKATTDEVFKELDVDINFEYQVPNLTDTTLTDSLHLERQDSVIVDWALIDEGAASRAFTKMPTRGDDEKKDDEEKETEDKLRDVKTVAWSIKKETNFPKPRGLGMYIEGTQTTVVKKLIHYRARKKNNFCESWEEDHSYVTFDVDFGLTYNLNEKLNKNNVDKYKKLLDELFDEKDLSTPLEHDVIPPITVPLGPPGGFVLEVKLALTMDITVTGYGHATTTTYFPVKRTGSIKEDGLKDIVIDETTDEGRTKCTKLGINGKIEIKPSLTFTGLIKHSSGVGAGLELSLSTTFSVGKNFIQVASASNGYVYDKTDKQLMQAPPLSKNYQADMTLGFSVDFEAGLRFEFSPWGFKFMGVTWTFAKVNIFNYSHDYGVLLNQSQTKLKAYSVRESDHVTLLTPRYSIRSTGLGLSGKDPNVVARLRFYNSTHSKFFDLVTKNYNGQEEMLTEDKLYEFQISKEKALSLLGEPWDGKFYIVPAYYDKGDGCTTVLADYEELVGTLMPTMEIKSCKQVYATEVPYLQDPVAVLKRLDVAPLDPDYWKGVTCYSFRTQVELGNTASIERWGINVVVKNAKGMKQLGVYDCEVADRSNDQLIKMGLYTIRSEFLSDWSEWNYANNSAFRSSLYLFVTPYCYVKGTRHDGHGKKLELTGVMQGEEKLEDYENYRVFTKSVLK